MFRETDPLRLFLIGLPSLLIALSALGGVPFAAFAGEVPAMNLMGFEVVNLAAGIIGILLGLGRFRTGTGLGALCVAGAVAVGSLFGSISTQHSFAGLEILPITFARAGLAGIILLGATLLMLGLRPGPWIRLILGAALALPPLAIAGMAALGRGGQLLSKFGTMPPAVSMFIGSIVFIIGSILLAIGVQLVVRAFELGIASEKDAQSEDPLAKSPTPAAE